MRVIVGRLTPSMSASSLAVSGPWRPIEARVAVEVGVSPLASVAASWRRRREVRTIAIRSWAAESVSGVSAFACID